MEQRTTDTGADSDLGRSGPSASVAGLWRRLRVPAPWRPLLRRSARVAVVLLAVVAPFAGAVVALRYAPPGHTEIAGAGVTVKPVLGQNSTKIQDGAIIRPEHAVLPLVGKAVGADISIDWNQLIPQDEQTRRYLGELWQDPAPAKDVIRTTATRVAVTWTAIGSGAVIVIEVGTWLMLRQRRRRLAGYEPQAARLVAEHNRRLRWTATGVALVTLVALDLGGAVVWRHEDDQVVIGSTVFADTGLAGTQVDGLISEVVPFLSILQPRSAFYDKVAANLETAIAGRSDMRTSADDVVFVTAEDFEDVNGMAQAVGRAADLVGADFIAYTGDLTFAGKPVESYIIDTLTYYAHGTPVEFAPGLHDTDAIVQAAAARGWHVADDTTHDVSGLDVLTLADPRISTVGDFGVGDVLREPGVDVKTFTSQAIEEACATHPAFIFLHDHLLGRKLAAQGCAQVAVIDGRSYTFVGPQQVPTTSGTTALEFTQGSSGGHSTTEPNPGRIKSPATFEIFVYDKAAKTLGYELVTVRPDASVSVGPLTPVVVPTPKG